MVKDNSKSGPDTQGKICKERNTVPHTQGYESSQPQLNLAKEPFQDEHVSAWNSLIFLSFFL